MYLTLADLVILSTFSAQAFGLLKATDPVRKFVLRIGAEKVL